MSKPLRSQPTRDRILEAARGLFGTLGYDRTTIRGIAAAAGIHASMVMRYYGSKEDLFALAASFDLQLPPLKDVAPDDIGRTMVAHFLDRWQRDDQELPVLLRAAITHDQARERLAGIFTEQISPAIAPLCKPGSERDCAALLATQMLGLALARFVLKLPGVVALSDALIVEAVGATVQRYVVGEERTVGAT